MGYTSQYAQKMMGGGREDRKKRGAAKSSEKNTGNPVRIKYNGNEVKTEKFTRKDAVNWKKEHGTEQSVRKIKKAGVKAKF